MLTRLVVGRAVIQVQMQSNCATLQFWIKHLFEPETEFNRYANQKTQDYSLTDLPTTLYFHRKGSIYFKSAGSGREGHNGLVFSPTGTWT